MKTLLFMILTVLISPLLLVGFVGGVVAWMVCTMVRLGWFYVQDLDKKAAK